MTTAQRESAKPKSQTRRAALLLAAVALLVGGGWWWTHPGALPDAYGASVDADPRPYRPGVTWHAELTTPGQFPKDGTVSLRSIEVTLDEAHETVAAIEVLRCAPVATDDGDSLSVGFGDDRPSEDYGCVPATEGTEMAADDHLVAVLTPSGPGKYVIESATVGYRLDAAGLWRRGTDTTRLHVAVTYS